MNHSQSDLASLIKAADDIAADAKATFGPLSPAQLNWKPSADRWSVGQCFDHLQTSNEGYFPIIDDVLGGKKQTFWERMPFLPGLSARMLLKFLDPASTRKVKAPARFEPTQSDVSDSIIDEFVTHQAKLIDKMRSTEQLLIDKIVITSPVSGAITYSLLNAYRIIIVHELRHFQQAKRVTEEPAFPH